MKLLSTLLATVILSTANAQNTEFVNYELNTHQKIHSLRLSAVNSTAHEKSPSSPIGSIHDSTVCLYLNPLLDYELMVNNTLFIKISSSDIQESLRQEEEVSPVFMVAAKNWIIQE